MANLTKHGHLVWVIRLSHGHLDVPFKKINYWLNYNLTFGQNGHFIQKNQPKELCVFQCAPNF